MDADSKKPKSKHTELAQKILDVAKERGLQPGDRLAEQALASACNVSRTPVRKALHLLAEREMVRTDADGGYVLAKEPASFEHFEDEGEGAEIYAAILRDLSAGRIGDSQTVASLQRRYAASRTAVQNALIKLSDANLAERAPGQQWLIKHYAMSADAVAHSFEFRLACEPLALSLPGFKRDLTALSRLRQVMEQLRAIERGQLDLAADLMRVHLQLSHAQRPRIAGRGVPQLFKVAG